MTSRTIRFLAITMALLISFTTVSYAGISDATMLFLRIAPGARAAGMGEAYVAIADDATATHWNPAGLGAFPLSASWLDTDLPISLRPITDIAAVKIGSGANYLDYELWAITAQGLRRYDNRKWHDSELFSVPSSAQLDQFVGRYFAMVDDLNREAVTLRVAQANNSGSYESLEILKDSVMSLIPDSYSPKEQMALNFDSLLTGFMQCRIDWNYVTSIKKHLNDGLKDNELSERDMDRIQVAVERAHLRYIKEEIVIPFTALFENTPTLLESNGEVLLVGSDAGLFQMRKSAWRRLTVDDGLPSENIISLKSIPSGEILIGTDKGVVVHDGNVIKLLAAEVELPEGRVESMSANSLSDIWAVVNKELYHYSNSSWSANREYTVVLDDDVDKLSQKYQVYGTETEAISFKTKLAGIDQYFEPEVVEEEKPIGVPAGQTFVVIDSIAPEVPDSSEIEEIPEPVREFISLPDTLVPGSKIRLPFLSEIKGEVYDIYAQNGVIWIGTEYGVLRCDDNGWEMPGWEEVVVESSVSLDTSDDSSEVKDVKPATTDLTISWDNLIALRAAKDQNFAAADSTVQEKYLETVRVLNDLDGSPLEAGQTILIYARPNAYPIHQIDEYQNNLYFVTETGLLEYNSGGWHRAGFKDLGSAKIADILTVDNEIWFLTDRRIVAKGRGKSEITLMHANWLEGLGVEDMFYAYAGFVTSTEGLGTFGGNITYLSYGSIPRTDAGGNSLGSFDPFEVALTASYGTALTKKLKGGVSLKFIYSRLSEFGAGEEKGTGITWAFGFDFGFMYQIDPRLNLGLAITNLGPDVQYSDKPQQDPLPRNIAFGFALKAYQSDDMNVLIVGEANKSLVDIGDPRAEEFKEIIWSGGAELDYLNLISVRAGYYHDEVGKVKNVSFGAGITPMDLFKVDFAFIPDNNGASMANTMRLSFTLFP